MANGEFPGWVPQAETPGVNGVWRGEEAEVGSTAAGKPTELSDRDFLNVSGFSLGAFGLGLPVIRGLFNWIDEAGRKLNKEEALKKGENLQLSPEAMLEYCGLEDYLAAYERGLETERLFGTTPPVFTGMYETLARACRGEFSNYNDPEIVSLREGWGKKDIWQAVGPAQEHAEGVGIRIDPEAWDTEEEIRKFLLATAEYYPLHSLVLPPEVSVQTPFHCCESKSPAMALMSFAEVQEQARAYYLYQTNRRLTWIMNFLPGNQELLDKIKPYIRRVDYANYAAAHWDCLNNSAVHFLNQPEKLAVDELTSDLSFNSPWEGTVTESGMREFTDQIGEWCGRFRIGEIPPGEVGDAGAAKIWGIFLQRIGSRLAQTPENERQGGMFEEMASLFRDGFRMKESNLFFPGLLNGFVDSLAGPVTVTVLGYSYILPNEESEIGHGYLKGIAAYLQQMRNNCLSNLYINSDFSEIRKSVGLPQISSLIAVTPQFIRDLRDGLREEFNTTPLDEILAFGGLTMILATLKKLIDKLAAMPSNSSNGGPVDEG